jgi:FkbM family methyltransferase
MNLFEILYKISEGNLKGVIHVGAHWGQEDPIYRSMNIKNVLFYEPLPHVFNVLKNNVGDSEIRNKALGNTSGKIEMFLETANYSQSSSILKPKKHLEQYPEIAFNEKILVDINRFDDEGLDKNKYDFLNIDTQGYELEVLKGATETLKNIKYIMCEVNFVEMYEECAQIDDLDEFLKEYGFSKYAVETVMPTWGNALYVK